MTASSTSCEHMIMYPECEVAFKYMQTEIKSILYLPNRNINNIYVAYYTVMFIENLCINYYKCTTFLLTDGGTVALVYTIY